MFNLYLRFDESLGEDGLARDYNVLGEENLEEIVKRYRYNYAGRYATRDDLGGVGNVDYLIVPYRFTSTHAEHSGFLAIGELGRVYYYPINLACFWFGTFILDGYRSELLRVPRLLENIKEEYFYSLKKFQEESSKSAFGVFVGKNSYMSIYKPSYYEAKVDMAMSFDYIVNSRSDLFFQEDGFNHQLKYFLKDNGIEVFDKSKIEGVYPLLFKTAVTYPQTKSEKKLLSVYNNGEMFRLFKEKGDIFFEKKTYYIDSSTALSPKWFNMNRKRNKDLITKTSSPIDSAEDVFEILVNFIMSNFNNVIALRLVFHPFVNESDTRSSVNVDIELLYINSQGFVVIEKLEESTFPSNVFFDILYIRAYDVGKGSLVHSPIPAIIENLIQLDNIPIDRFTGGYRYSEIPETFIAHVEDSRLPLQNWTEWFHSKLNNSVKSARRTDFQRHIFEDNETVIGPIDWFFQNYKEYRKYQNSKHRLLADFLDHYAEEFHLKRFIVTFSSVDLSLTIEQKSDEHITEDFLKVIRNGEYIDFTSPVENFTDDDILSLYKEVIDYVFFLQKNLVERYGRIEYLFELEVRNQSVRWIRFYLLTEDRLKLMIHENRV